MAFMTNGERFTTHIEHTSLPVIFAPQIFQAFHLMKF